MSNWRPQRCHKSEVFLKIWLCLRCSFYVPEDSNVAISLARLYETGRKNVSDLGKLGAQGLAHQMTGFARADPGILRRDVQLHSTIPCCQSIFKERSEKRPICDSWKMGKYVERGMWILWRTTMTFCYRRCLLLGNGVTSHHLHFWIFPIFFKQRPQEYVARVPPDLSRFFWQPLPAAYYPPEEITLKKTLLACLRIDR
jgi:hypothetical protein